MGEVTVTQCPNCGGPVDPRAFAGVADPKCPHCHFALPMRADPPPPPRPITIDVSGLSESATKAARRTGVGVLIFVLVFAVGLPIAIIAIVASASSKAKHAFGGSGVSIDGQVVPAGGAATDVFSLTRTSGSPQMEILNRVDPIHRKVLWSTPPLDQQSEGVPTIVVGTGQVFAIYGSTVVGFDPTTGRRLWQGSLSNDVASPCADPCAVVLGTRLVVLTKDGVVQALDTATGGQAWTKRLAATPRYLEPAGASVVTIDTAPGGADRVADVITVASGAMHQIAPSCPPNPDLPDLIDHPSDDADFFVSHDGTALTVIIPGGPGCVAHYRLADGAPLWVTPSTGDNGPVPFTLTGNSTVQGANTLLWTGDHGNDYTVYALDENTGAIRSVTTFTKSMVTLDGVLGSQVVADVAPSFDSEKPAVVAVDLASGVQKWTVATRVRLSGDTQKTVMSATAPIIVSCNSSSDHCLFEAVDPATGTIRGSSGSLPATPGQADEVPVRVTPTAVVATVGWEHAAALDPTTAAVRWTWPS